MYELGNVNVDSLKEVLSFLGQVYPFVDETSKTDFAAQVAALDTAGDPAEAIAAAKTAAAEAAGTTTPETAATTTETTPAAESTASGPSGDATANEPVETVAEETSEQSELDAANAKIAELEAQIAAQGTQGQ